MEWTQSDPVAPHSAQRQVTLHNVYQRNSFAQPLYVVITNGHASRLVLAVVDH